MRALWRVKVMRICESLNRTFQDYVAFVFTDYSLVWHGFLTLAQNILIIKKLYIVSSSKKLSNKILDQLTLVKFTSTFERFKSFTRLFSWKRNLNIKREFVTVPPSYNQWFSCCSNHICSDHAWMKSTLGFPAKTELNWHKYHWSERTLHEQKENVDRPRKPTSKQRHSH